jgi:hypothetical protein
MANELLKKIKTSWIQQFQENNGIVIRAQTGELLCSPEKETYLEMKFAYHIRELQCQFEAGLLDEKLLRNADETHLSSTWTTVELWAFVEKNSSSTRTLCVVERA